MHTMGISRPVNLGRRAIIALCCLFAMSATHETSAQPWIQQAKVMATDAAPGDLFGVTVTINGDTAVVGSHLNDPAGVADAGAAYVFVRTNGGQPGCDVWTQQAKLTAPILVSLERFAWSVAIDGDTIIVGSYEHDIGGIFNAGAAYVFVRSGMVWTQQAILTSPIPATDNYFGYAVSIDGDTALIGARYDDLNVTAIGAAYVFVRTGTVWNQQARLTASDAAALDEFGVSVSLSGDTALIGAQTDDHAGGSDAGSAYAYIRTGTVWSQQAKLTASDSAATDNFGLAVSLDGDSALVGAWHDDHAAGSNAGSAYVFTRGGTVWSQQAKLIATDAASLDEFGYSVSISGDRAIAGASFSDQGLGGLEGSAYVFARTGGAGGTTWSQQAKVKANDAALGDRFGWSVSIHNDTAIVGALRENPPTGNDEGAAYIFASDTCRADIHPRPAGNGFVNVDDLLMVINHWGRCSPPCPAACPCIGDIDRNCFVNTDDLLAIINAWGPCP